MEETGVCGHQNTLRTLLYLLAGMLLLRITVSGQTTTTVNRAQIGNFTLAQALTWLQSNSDVDFLIKIIKGVKTDILLQIYKMAITENWKTDRRKMKVIEALNEEVMEGAQRNLTLASVQSLGISAVYYVPTNKIRELTDDTIKYLLDAISTGTGYLIEGMKEMKPAMDTSVMALAADRDTARLKAYCQRAFRLYTSAKDINSNEGWKNIKYLLFCAPPEVCSSVDATLLQSDNVSVAWQPWVCNIQEMRGTDEQLSGILTVVRKLFPENRACGEILAAKLSKNGITSAEDLKSFGSLSDCISAGSMKQVVDSSCDSAIKALQENLLDSKIASYTVKKCANIPKTFEGVTCTSIREDLGVFLPYMDRKFFKDLPRILLCNTDCLTLFKEAGSRLDDVMSFVMKTCYDRKLSTEEVKSLGSMVTDMPADKVADITNSDLRTTLNTIKEDLNSYESKKKGRNELKRAVVEILAKKVIADGSLSKIIDSKAMMKEVSLRDLKNSLSSSTDVIAALNVGSVNGTVAMTDSQKKWVMKKVLTAKDVSTFTVDYIRSLKSMVTGLSSSAIQEMGAAHANDTGGMDLAQEMCTYADWPMKSLEAINENLIYGALRVKNESNPIGSFSVDDVVNIGCECLMTFNATEYENMPSYVCSALCQKIGYCNRFRCLNPVSRSNVLQVCLKCKNLGSQPMTDTDLVELGPNLIAQMSPTQLKYISPEVLKSSLGFLKTMCMDQTTRTVLGESITKIYGGDASGYSSEELYLLGSAIKLLPRSVQTALNKKTLSDLTMVIMEDLVPTSDEGIRLNKCCRRWLSDTDNANLDSINFDMMLTLKEAMFSDTTLNRKKRSTHIIRKRSTYSWTCSQIRLNPLLFLTATDAEITAMSDIEFIECMSDIGRLSGLKSSQRTSLLSKAKVALKRASVCDMTITELVDLGVIASAFSTSDLKCLPLTDSSLVTTLGSLTHWTSADLSVLAQRYLTSRTLSSLSGLTSADISMLGSILCGFTPSQIGTIPSAELGKSGAQIAELSMCSTEALVALKSRIVAVDAYGPVASWTAAEISELKYIIAGLSGAEIQSLTLTALEGLLPEVIPAIPPMVLKWLSITQLSTFTDNQAVSVTDAQRAAMTAEQLKVLGKLESGNQEQIQEVTIVDQGSSGGTTNRILTCSILAIVLTVFVL